MYVTNVYGCLKACIHVGSIFRPIHVHVYVRIWVCLSCMKYKKECEKFCFCPSVQPSPWLYACCDLKTFRRISPKFDINFLCQAWLPHSRNSTVHLTLLQPVMERCQDHENSPGTFICRRTLATLQILKQFAVTGF